MRWVEPHFSVIPSEDEAVIGFRIMINSAALKAHLLARAEYHKRRASEKATLLPNLRTQLEELRQTRPDPQSSYRDLVRPLIDSDLTHLSNAPQQ